MQAAGEHEGVLRAIRLATGLEALVGMMEGDAVEACGRRHELSRRRTAYRWEKTKGKMGFHGGSVGD
jgi:hypothetical protein